MEELRKSHREGYTWKEITEQCTGKDFWENNSRLFRKTDWLVDFANNYTQLSTRHTDTVYFQQLSEPEHLNDRHLNTVIVL